MERKSKAKVEVVKEPIVTRTKVEVPEKEVKLKKEVVVVAEEPIVVEEAFNVETPKLFKWKKLGGGSLRLPNRIIKPGETFLATKEELPKSFMDTLVCLEEAEMKAYEQKKATAIKRADTRYSLEETEDGQWNIVSEDGKVLNERPLMKESAEELKNALEA